MVICFVWSLCVCLSVLKKIMNNFWMEGQNWMKFSGVTRLLLRKVWVGSTPAQSLQIFFCFLIWAPQGAMYVNVLYRNPNWRKDLVEIWHIGGPRGREGSWGCFNPVPTPPGYGVHKGDMGCLWSHSLAFWQNLYKTKFAGRPWFSGGGSPFSPQILTKRGPGGVLQPQQCILAKALQ